MTWARYVVRVASSCGESVTVSDTRWWRTVRSMKGSGASGSSTGGKSVSIGPVEMPSIWRIGRPRIKYSVVTRGATSG